MRRMTSGRRRRGANGMQATVGLPKASWLACGCAALALASAVVGCSRGGPAVQYVEGVVSMDGSPVAAATVGYSPVGGGLAAFGMTDAAGRYKLTTAQGGRPAAGAPVGEYVVTVKKYRDRVAELGRPPNPEEDPKGSAAWKAAYDRVMLLPLESLIPEGYADPGLTPLRVTVARGRNVGPAFSFELSGTLPPKR